MIASEVLATAIDRNDMPADYAPVENRPTSVGRDRPKLLGVWGIRRRVNVEVVDEGPVVG